jgi:outer membrane receptor protein involved in Fe transport
LAFAGLLGVSLAAPPAQARSDTYNLDIPAESLGDALQAFALASQHKLLYSSKLVEGLNCPGLKGEYSAEDAIKRLLSGTNLTYKITADGLVVIRSQETGASTQAAIAGAGGAAEAGQPGMGGNAQDQKEKSQQGDSFRVAQANQGQTAGTGAVGSAGHITGAQTSGTATTDQENRTWLQEVVVTARKREEQLLDVPMPVAVLSADALTATNQTNIQDYYMQVPGVSFSPDFYGNFNLSIRGITTGGIASGNTVGVVIDDVPYAGTLIGFDPGDLNRIEVLRGPQGTLYGSAAMGGLVKFVTRDPSPDRFEGRLEASTETIYNANSLGYGLRASLNLPVNESLAVRISGFTREVPGYLDNPILHIDGINVNHVSGGHLALLWKPSENFSAKLSAFFQDTRAESTTDVTTLEFFQDFNGTPVVGNLKQAYIRGAGVTETLSQIYSAILDWKIGVVDLTSLTGYNVDDRRATIDVTSQVGSLAPTTFPGFAGTLFPASAIATHFSEEIRASASFGSHVDGLLGLYYSNAEGNWGPQAYLASNPYTGAIGGLGIFFRNAGWFPAQVEHAVFGNVTWHVTQKLDIQVGAREHYIKQNSPEQIYSGPWTPLFTGQESPFYVSEYDIYSHAFTYLFTPSYRISPDQMIYMRLASGFRPGGVNLPETTGVPPTFAPDKTLNYELGLKGDYLNHRLSIDSSIYYIDWNGLQTVLATNNGTGLTYTANAGGAKSQGLELSAEARPVERLKISGWVVFSEAVMTKAFLGQGAAAPGDRLPYSARFSGNLAADGDFHLMGEVNGEAGVAVSYVGGREDVFNTPRQYLPPYAKTDLHVNATYRTWTTTLYVNNLTNRYGLISGGLGNMLPFRFNYIQPRTVGLSVVKTF